MASRGMRLRSCLTVVLVLLLAAWPTYQLKYTVREREFELGRLRKALDRERDALQLARVELDYLTRPERLVVLAGQLGMVPGRGAHIIEVTRVVPAPQLELAREPLPALLPSGAGTILKIKPLPGVLLARGGAS